MKIAKACLFALSAITLLGVLALIASSPLPADRHVAPHERM